MALDQSNLDALRLFERSMQLREDRIGTRKRLRRSEEILLKEAIATHVIEIDSLRRALLPPRLARRRHKLTQALAPNFLA